MSIEDDFFSVATTIPLVAAVEPRSVRVRTREERDKFVRISAVTTEIAVCIRKEKHRNVQYL
jgi:hypothetical protein